MNESPLVTIVMPAYNAAKYICETIESVLRQSFSDYELLVVNDFSKDNTAEIIGNYIKRDSRIKIINLPSNMGAPAGPRNIGIHQAKGKWIAFLDADDIWHPNKLQRQIELLEITKARFCSTKMVDFVESTDVKLSDAFSSDYEWVSFIQQLIRYRTPTSSVIVEKSLITENLFNEDIRFKAREDLDCWLRCHEIIGKSVKITTPMLGYRIIPGQISGNKWLMIRRHLYVLRQFKFRSGRELGLPAYFFLATHFICAFYSRKILKSM